ncbi:MAG TPA: zinc ABC transporter substrate-binding protein [Thermohalobaculum sp.]|nr:zinc ABC transporter substrate-binding protein [Thermohalobaculum sp.]
MRTAPLTLAAALAAPLALGAAPAAAASDVVATTGMVADAARAIGGDCLAVDQMMGPGTDPHLYRAGASDVRALGQADAILYSGLFLEGQLGEVLEKLGARTPTVAVAEAGLPEDRIIRTGEGYGIDPHVWMDAGLWSGVADPVADLVAELEPGCAEAARARADTYRAELEALDRWIAEAIATIPDDRRVLVTAHDAFEYYGRAYDIEVVGIQGVSTESEAGIADIRAVVDRVVAEKIPAIFVESTISPRTVQAVIAAATERGHDLALGPELYSDAMGADGTADGTFIGMLVSNTRGIVEALGGEVPPLPEALRPWAKRWSVELAREGE